MAEQNAQELTRARRELIKDIMQDSLHGKHIYLLGSAEFGPTNEPIMVKSTVGLYNKFGKQGTLIDAFHALKYTSKNNTVYLVKTTGEHANAYLNVNIQGGEIIENGFTITSSESNEAFNDIQILVDVTGLTVIFPEDFNMQSIKYEYKKGKTYALYDIYNGVEKIGEYGNWEDVIKAVKQRLAETGWECRLECREIWNENTIRINIFTKIRNDFISCTHITSLTMTNNLTNHIAKWTIVVKISF